MTDEQIIDHLGLVNLPKEVQDETLRSIRRAVELRVISLAEELMTEDQKEELRLKAKENPESVWRWLKKDVSDVDKLYESALKVYLDEKVSKKS